LHSATLIYTLNYGDLIYGYTFILSILRAEYMSSQLANKLRKIREAETSGRAEFCDIIGIAKKTLEGIEQTGRVPKGDLLEKVCQTWPKYTLWLMTGSTDPECGQVDPDTEIARRENCLKTG